MKLNSKSLVRVLSVFCVAAITLTMLFADFGIISALTDGSDDSTVSKDDLFASNSVYRFEADEEPVSTNSVNPDSVNMTRGGDGMGIMGWTYNIYNRGGDHGNVLCTHNDGYTHTWGTSGGYRLNNYDGVYRLKPATTYVVDFEVNLTSAPKSTETFKKINTSTVYIGYGAWDNPNDGNAFNSMSVKLYDVVSAKTDETSYAVNTTEGTVYYDVDSGWKKAKVVFTTPDDFGSYDNVLSFYSSLWPYTSVDIDNVEITELSKEQGAVIFTDEYHGKNIVAVGTVGEKAEMPVITPDNPEHKFEGWYSNYDRKDADKIEECKFTAGIKTVYARFDAPVTVTFKNTITGETTVVSGKPGQKVPFPANPTDSVMKFKAWYRDEKYTEFYDDTVFYYSNITVYSCFVDPAKIITFDGDYNFDQSNSLQFGKLVDIVNAPGIGNGDNYALSFTYDADKYYGTSSDGTIRYQKDRYNDPDHTAILTTGLKPNTVYLVSYDVKATKATLDYSVSFATAYNGNIWASTNMYRNGNDFANRITFSKTTAGGRWVRKTVAIETSATINSANALYIYFTVAHGLDDGAATVYVDNISIEEATAPMVVFQPLNGKDNIILTGNVGDAIAFPKNPTRFANVFDAWYTDVFATNKFEATEFSRNEVLVACAGYKAATTNVYDYEDYNVPYSDASNCTHLRHDCEVITSKIAYSGTHVMKADRSFIRNPKLNRGGAGHLIQSGDISQRMIKGTNYIITFKYYIETAGQAPLGVRAYVGSASSFWGSSFVSNDYSITIDEEVGKWHTGTLVCNGDLIAQGWQDRLYLSWHGGDEGMYYFDDITVAQLDEGQMAYFIDNGGCKNIPEYVVGRPGQSFASQLPKNPKYENHEFLGYYVLGTDGKFQSFTDMVFRKDKTPSVVARFIRKKTVQDFETFYAPAIAAMPGYSIIDFDYELYDATAEGNSKDNVTSGNRCLHRLGNSAFFENALLLTQAQQLIADEKYTVTMKIKMGKHSHTNGAVKIVSNNSGVFAWTPYGDYYPVVSISDLADGQWHEVSYTFTAIEPYVSIQTPGYCEIFVDDVVFDHQPQNTAISKPIQFTEYVIGEQEEAIDVTQIIDLNLGSNTDFTVYIIIGAAAVLIIAAAVILLIVFKRKKGGQK